MQQWLFVLGVSFLVWNLHVSAVQLFDWAYGGSIGPAEWSKTYLMCGGSHQSPINIDTSKMRHEPTLKPFTISLKSALGEYTVKNFGLNTEIFFEGTTWEAKFEGSPQYCFRLHQIHFHWGSENSKGSEHTINGQQYPLEAHIVMYNCRLYPNATVASGSVNGLAVLSVLFKIDNDVPENPVMKNIVSALGEQAIRQCPCSTPENIAEIKMSGFDINLLLPSNRKDFYRYDGSLTTPPCTENVMWTILKENVYISDAQINVFRSMLNRKNNNGGIVNMYNNFRPVNPLNPETPIDTIRLVSSTFAGSGTITPSLMTLVFCAFSIFTSKL